MVTLRPNQTSITPPLLPMPLTIATAVRSELLICKSRFIGCVQPVTDRAEAQNVVAELRAQHPGAAHVCWALLAGGQSAAVDDGEPSGTAGRPMLEVLRRQGLEGVLATAVRYFGGVKLGAGGLVRAYTGCVAQALLNAQKVAIVKTRTLYCNTTRVYEGLVRRELSKVGAKILNVEHGTYVEIDFCLPETDAEGLIALLNEAGHGQIVWRGKKLEPVRV